MLWLCMLVPTPMLAQQMEKKYGDLFDMYIIDNYEKCMKKAMKYTESEKTKRDDEPWLYVCMSYYKMSQMSEFTEKYPDALMESIKAGTKFRKADRSGKTWEANQDFFDEYKEYMLNKFGKEVKNGSYKDATKYLKKFTKVDEQDFGLQIITGVVHLLADKAEGEMMITAALDSLNAEYKSKKYEPQNMKKDALMQEAFVDYTAMLAKKEDYMNLAKKIAETGKNIMTDNDEVQRQYARLNR